MNYKYLSLEERERIQENLNRKMKPKQIAFLSNRHISTIYRVIKRNKDKNGHYKAIEANNLYLKRRRVS